MKEILIFSDGSALGNPGPGGYGTIIQYGAVEKILCGGEIHTTNNRMELLGVIEGLRILKEPCAVTIVSDSMYVLKGIDEWLAGWVKRNFAKVKNPDLWKEYLIVSRHHTITVKWVKGHNGHKENERCDLIAKTEAERYKAQKIAEGKK